MSGLRGTDLRENFRILDKGYNYAFQALPVFLARLIIRFF